MWNPFAQIQQSLAILTGKVDKLMSQQSDLDALVAQLVTALDTIATEVAALVANQQAGQPLDLSGLSAAVTQAQADATAAAPPPPEPAAG